MKLTLITLASFAAIFVSAHPLKPAPFATDMKDPKKTDPSQVEEHVISVKNYVHIEREYKQLLADKKQPVVFYLEDSDTFLSRAKPVSEDLDNIDGKTPTAEGNEWVEFSYEDKEILPYDGIIAGSSCQRQHKGGTGAIDFSYSLMKSHQNSFSLDAGLGVTYEILALGIHFSIGITKVKSETSTGAVSCTLNPGQTGQIFLRPNYIRFVPKSRRSELTSKLNFVVRTRFQRHKKLEFLLKNHIAQIDCATDDVVELYCDNVRIGVPNWDDPLKLKYV